MDLAKWVRAQWDRVLAWVCVAAGAVVLIVGWVGVSRYAYPADQLPYILSGGIGGLFLLGLGAMLWLSADLRDEWRKLDDIDRRNARFYDSQPTQITGGDDRRAFQDPVAVPAAPTPAPVMVDSVDDTRESVVVGRAKAGLVAGESTAPQPAPAAKRRSGTASVRSTTKRHAGTGRAVEKGLARP